GGGSILGRTVFDALPSAYPFILSLPQDKGEKILENSLKKHHSVNLLRNRQVVGLQTGSDLVQVRVLDLKKKTKQGFTAAFLCACDGKNSAIREQLDIPFTGGTYRQAFLMADYHDETSFGSDAHLFFTSQGPVESFPLPGRKRRWIVDTPSHL